MMRTREEIEKQLLKESNLVSKDSKLVVKIFEAIDLQEDFIIEY